MCCRQRSRMRRAHGIRDLLPSALIVCRYSLRGGIGSGGAGNSTAAACHVPTITARRLVEPRADCYATACSVRIRIIPHNNPFVVAAGRVSPPALGQWLAAAMQAACQSRPWPQAWPAASYVCVTSAVWFRRAGSRCCDAVAGHLEAAGAVLPVSEHTQGSRGGLPRRCGRVVERTNGVRGDARPRCARRKSDARCFGFRQHRSQLRPS
jgi:hypothetical protein